MFKLHFVNTLNDRMKLFHIFVYKPSYESKGMLVVTDRLVCNWKVGLGLGLNCVYVQCLNCVSNTLNDRMKLFHIFVYKPSYESK